ncbi:MAG: NACHT domain-containing protein [Cyanobacteria bacterium P01_F01_bin.53]
MLESSISGIAVSLFDQLCKGGSYIVEQVDQARQKVRDTEEILKASKNYQQKYETRHGQMKIMPGLMKEAIPLTSIYTAVKLLDKHSIRQFASRDELEKLYRDQGKRRFQTADRRHDGITIAKEQQYLMVLGSPGVGKSTFLRKLGLEALKGQQGQLKRQQIPVFIELKTFRNNTIDLKTVIANEFKICGFPDTQAFTDLSLKQGKLFILLDGLDEVPANNVNQVIEHIEAFAIQHNENTFVASCRTAAYRSSFQQFLDVTIADFDDGQIEQFIQRWFNSQLDTEADTANRYWELLQHPNNKAAKELAQTPLLLTFLCLIYEREQRLPNKRSTLYGRALNILLSEWSAQKRLEQGPIYEDFNPELEKDLLSKIAYTSFEEDQLFFSKQDITDRITKYLADTLDAPRHLDGPAILQTIEIQQGILVQRATDTYSFSHLTLQEYLTAMYIVNNQLVSELVSQHLTKERWREVFLLVVGLLGRQGSELLDIIDQQARTVINDHPNIRSLVQWANHITKESPYECESFAKTAIAIAIACASAIDSDRASDRASNLAKAIAITRARDIRIAAAPTTASLTAIAIARARSIDNDRKKAQVIVKACSRAIDKAIDSINYLNKIQLFNKDSLQELPSQLLILKIQIPQPEADFAEWVSYANELEDTFLNALGLRFESISLSAEEWNGLNNYLHAHELLLRCKQASIGISRTAWETIEKRLLTI